MLKKISHKLIKLALSYMEPEHWYGQKDLSGEFVYYFYSTKKQKNGAMAGIMYSHGKATKSQVTPEEYKNLWEEISETDVPGNAKDKIKSRL